MTGATAEEAEEARAMLARTCRAVLAALSPASARETGAVLEALALHYPQYRRTDAENRIATRQWAEDLEDWPLDLIEDAARRWRNSCAERFPTPGQFKGAVQAVLDQRRFLGRRAAAVLEALLTPTRPSSAAEPSRRAPG